MCLIFCAFQQHPQWPLIVVSNRDEFFQRPSLEGHFWAPQFNLLGGRDQEQGGTWLAAHRNGRFAAVTNYRRPNQAPGLRSRGFLVSDFVDGTDSAADYVQQLTPGDYTGFNLLLGDIHELHYAGNRELANQRLTPGVYGLSNQVLDSPWPKVREGKALFSKLISEPDIPVEALFNLMTDDTQAPLADLPETGVGQDIEHHLSSRFIPAKRPGAIPLMDGYGTRTTTVLMINQAGGQWFERNHSEAAINNNRTLAFTWESQTD